MASNFKGKYNFNNPLEIKKAPKVEKMKTGPKTVKKRPGVPKLVKSQNDVASTQETEFIKNFGRYQDELLPEVLKDIPRMNIKRLRRAFNSSIALITDMK